MKKIGIIVLIILVILVITDFLIKRNNNKNVDPTFKIDNDNFMEEQENEVKNIQENIVFDNLNGENEKEVIEVNNIKIRVNNEVLEVKLEQNSSSEALLEILKQGDITINAHDYGDFEKVGGLGFNLPTNDTRITTKPGDLMLYQGNQITLFYESNVWSYTKIGEVIGKSKDELKAILGSGNVTLVLSIE